MGQMILLPVPVRVAVFPREKEMEMRDANASVKNLLQWMELVLRKNTWDIGCSHMRKVIFCISMKHFTLFQDVNSIIFIDSIALFFFQISILVMEMMYQ